MIALSSVFVRAEHLNQSYAIVGCPGGSAAEILAGVPPGAYRVWERSLYSNEARRGGRLQQLSGKFGSSQTDELLLIEVVSASADMNIVLGEVEEILNAPVNLAKCGRSVLPDVVEELTRHQRSNRRRALRLLFADIWAAPHLALPRIPSLEALEAWVSSDRAPVPMRTLDGLIVLAGPISPWDGHVHSGMNAVGATKWHPPRPGFPAPRATLPSDEGRPEPGDDRVTVCVAKALPGLSSESCSGLTLSAIANRLSVSEAGNLLANTSSRKLTFHALRYADVTAVYAIVDTRSKDADQVAADLVRIFGILESANADLAERCLGYSLASIQDSPRRLTAELAQRSLYSVPCQTVLIPSRDVLRETASAEMNAVREGRTYTVVAGPRDE